MKKYLMIVALFLCLFTFTACEKVSEEGNYKEGTYLGTVTDNYGGSKATAMAVVYVDANGLIKSVYLDTVYSKNDVFDIITYYVNKCVGGFLKCAVICFVIVV